MESTRVTRITEDTKVIMVNSACKRVWGGARGPGAGLAQGARMTRGAAEHKGEVYVPERGPIHTVKLNSCTCTRAGIARKGGRETAYHALLPFPVRHPLSVQSL